MIEEIKKEILEVFHNEHYQDMENSEYFMDDIIKILDKYKNQPDYKSAWNELKTNEMAVDKISLDIMQELEQKYNLGGE